MKRILKARKDNGKINPYPFMVLVVITLAVIFIVFHLVFQNRAF